MYPCDQCTKNFLTTESLKSHQQRKHSTIEEKHELSDDNEKGDSKAGENPKGDENSNKLESTIREETGASAQDISESNNNNENETNTNCNACTRKNDITSLSVAIQCELENIDLKDVSVKMGPEGN